MANTSGIRAGRAYVELGVSDKLTAGLKRAQKRLRAFGAGVSSIGRNFARLGAAIAAPLIVSVAIFAKSGDSLDKMSKRTGVSVEALSELGFAAEQSGSDLATLEKGIKTMQRSIVDAGRGLSTQTDALESLGLAYSDLKDLSPEAQFALIADRIGAIEDPTKRAAVSMQLLGRAGQSLVPLMAGGSKGMEELRKQARDLGLTISGDTAASAAEFTDTMNIMRRVLKQGAIIIGSALVPGLIKTAKFLTRVAITANKLVENNKSLIASIFKVASVVAIAGVALIGLGALFTLAGFAIGGVIAVFGALSAVVGLVASPIVLAGAAFAAFIALVATQTNIGSTAIKFLGDTFQKLADFAGPVFAGIRDAISAGDLELGVKIAGKGMEVAWQSVIVNMKLMWVDFVSFVQKTLLALPELLNVLGQGFEFGAGALLGAPGAFIGDVPRVPTPGSSLRASLITGIDGLNKSKTAELTKALDALKAELAALNANAAAGAANGGSTKFGRLGDLADALAEAAAGGLNAASSIGVRGTFNANAISGFGGQSRQVERTAVATEKTAMNTAKIIKKIESIPGNARFA